MLIKHQHIVNAQYISAIMMKLIAKRGKDLANLQKYCENQWYSIRKPLLYAPDQIKGIHKGVFNICFR